MQSFPIILLLSSGTFLKTYYNNFYWISKSYKQLPDLFLVIMCLTKGVQALISFPLKSFNMILNFLYICLHTGERDRVIKSFQASASKLKPIDELLLIHQRVQPIEKSVLISQLKMIEMTFKEFAKSQKGFTGLDVEDQHVLLKNNTPLFVQAHFN